MACEQNNPHHIYSVGEHTLHALAYIEADKVLRLTMLFHDFGKPEVKTTGPDGIDHFRRHPEVSEELAGKVLKRLKFDNETVRQVKKLVWCHDQHPALTPAGVRKALNWIGEDLFASYLKVQRADILAQSGCRREEKLHSLEMVGRIYEEVLEKGQCLSMKELAVSGKDLIADGMEPGKEIGRVLEALLNDVLEEPEHNTKEYLLAYSNICREQGLGRMAEQDASLT